MTSEPLRVTFDRIVGPDAVLTVGDASNQQLRLPKQSVPKSAKPGDEFVLELIPAAEAAEHKDVIARKLLEDILNGK